MAKALVINTLARESIKEKGEESYVKKIIILLSLLLCGFAFATTETINWYVDGNVYDTTTCQTGGDINLPTTPYKYGYTFHGWLGYTSIEYIESTGTQYINTGFKPNNNTRVVMEYYIKSNGRGGLFGARVGWQNSAFMQSYDGVFRTDYGKQYDGPSGSLTSDYYNTKLKIDENKNITYLYDSTNTLMRTVVLTPETFQTNYNMYLFAVNSAGSTWNPARSLSVYSCKIYDNGTLVRDMIPVLDDNGVACMYDKVSKQFFYNSGTGNFIAGPIINQ